jgi:hypothetical protein
MTELINLFLPDREAIYFCAEGWTAICAEAVICPSGKVSRAGMDRLKSIPRAKYPWRGLN